MSRIPTIDIAPFFNADAAARTRVDATIGEAAFDIGFMTIVGHPATLALGAAERTRMLQLFALPEEAQRPLWNRNFAPENASLYRG